MHVCVHQRKSAAELLGVPGATHSSLKAALTAAWSGRRPPGRPCIGSVPKRHNMRAHSTTRSWQSAPTEGPPGRAVGAQTNLRPGKNLLLQRPLPMSGAKVRVVGARWLPVALLLCPYWASSSKGACACWGTHRCVVAVGAAAARTAIVHRRLCPPPAHAVVCAVGAPCFCACARARSDKGSTENMSPLVSCRSMSFSPTPSTFPHTPCSIPLARLADPG
jgi:hypothetical protein